MPEEGSTTLGALFRASDLEIEIRNRESFLGENDIMDALEPMGLLRKVHRTECQGAW
jgi:hypothetical protein